MTKIYELNCPTCGQGHEGKAAEELRARLAVPPKALSMRVRLLKDIYDDGEDHHPPGHIGKRGEIVEVRTFRALEVAHEGATDNAFIVRVGEFEPVAAEPPEVTQAWLKTIAYLATDKDEFYTLTLGFSSAKERGEAWAAVEDAMAEANREYLRTSQTKEGDGYGHCPECRAVPGTCIHSADEKPAPVHLRDIDSGGCVSHCPACRASAETPAPPCIFRSGCVNGQPCKDAGHCTEGAEWKRRLGVSEPGSRHD